MNVSTFYYLLFNVFYYIFKLRGGYTRAFHFNYNLCCKRLRIHVFLKNTITNTQEKYIKKNSSTDTEFQRTQTILFLHLYIYKILIQRLAQKFQLLFRKKYGRTKTVSLNRIKFSSANIPCLRLEKRFRPLRSRPVCKIHIFQLKLA